MQLPQSTINYPNVISYPTVQSALSIHKDRIWYLFSQHREMACCVSFELFGHASHFGTNSIAISCPVHELSIAKNQGWQVLPPALL